MPGMLLREALSPGCSSALVRWGRVEVRVRLEPLGGLRPADVVEAPWVPGGKELHWQVSAQWRCSG